MNPPFLKSKSKVGIVATARRIRPEDVGQAITILESWGLEVVNSPYLFSEGHSYLAGTDDQREAALQAFLDDPEIEAIFCARGGYGTTRIIEQINFKEFKKFPKWIIGFSDITALHLKLAVLGVNSIHAIMPALFGKDDSKPSIESLRRALFDEGIELTGNENPKNRNGEATGKLIGGNLSLIVDSLGTSYEINTDGKILVLEEVDEYLYKLDRMFVQLKRAGKLDHVAGIVVGHFSEIKDTELSFGESFEDIIRYHTKEFNYPIGFNFPIGHVNPNFAWISGADAFLEVEENKSVLRLERVTQ